MFWTLTVNKLVGAPGPAKPYWPHQYGARPDLETGQRMLAVATEGGIVLTVTGPPTARPEAPVVAAGPHYRSTVHTPVK